MGAWGVGIFENDDALDIRDCFRRHARKGLSVEEITQKCMADYPDPMNDVSVVLALTALQMEQGRLMPDIRKRALRMIDEQQGIESWREPEKRMRELLVFREKLLRF